MLRRYHKGYFLSIHSLIHRHIQMCIHTMARYSARWRRPYRRYSLRRLTDEALDNRMLQRLDRQMRQALSGDVDACIRIFKAAGVLPRSFKTDREEEPLR